jgi:signal transduction histidine kinase/ActR/RegA family two-component response regulator
MANEDEEKMLRSAALQNAHTILAARQRAEEDLLQAKSALESRTSELAHTVAMLRATLEATTDGILVTDPEGNVVDFNEKYAAFWNIPHQILQQRKHRPLLEMVAARFDDPAGFIARAEAIYASSQNESFDVLHLADGRICERYSRIQFVDGENVGRVWTFREVTAQRRVEYALREEGRILELLNKTGTTIASKLSLELLLQEITDAATELSGAKFGAFFYNTFDHNGESLLLYTLSGAPRDAFEKFGNPRPTALFGPTFRGEPPIRSDDILQDPRYGKSSPFHGMPAGHLPVRSYLAVPVISRSGEVIGGLFFGHPEPAVFNARSERIILGVAAQAAVAIDNARLYEAAQKAAEDRAQLLERERNARQLAEEQNRSKDAFLAMLGHELRNPLSAISAGVAVIKAAGPNSDAAARAHEIIARQSNHLERIVDDLLDTARMLEGKITLEKRPADLAEAVRACLQSLESTGWTKGYTLDVALTPATLKADPARVDQIVNNLLTNALKYTPGGGKIDVTVAQEGAQAVLRISDNGIGIPADLIDRIFDPFVQGERSLDRSQGGLGIGLTLVRKLVELHGGIIVAESAGHGRGSTFTVRFPLAAEQEESDMPRMATDQVRRSTVLVIEDNPDALEMTAAMLTLSNYRVLRATNGREGIDMAKTEQPDVVVIDIGLPDLNGYEVARRMRADAATRTMRLIALTGYGSPEDVRSAITAGFETHMVKPVNFDRLVGAIEQPAARVG